MVFNAIEHSAIASPDPEHLAAWYVATLGFRVNYRLGRNVFVKAPDGSMIEIVPAEGERVELGLFQPGICHLAIAVGDFEAALASLREQGVRMLSEPREVAGNRLVFFADADGNPLHLIWRPAPLP